MSALAVDDDEIRAAAAWREAVEETVRAVASGYGRNAEELLDSQAFIRSLDAATFLGPDDPSLARVVEAAVAQAPSRVTESVVENIRLIGRIMEARGTAEAGGRVFRVRMLRYGDSHNGRRYSEAVMRTAAHLYEGSKAYDHHRDDGELRSSTIRGLVGHYQGVTAEADGLYGDLHLLPSASHAAEALDASIAAQAAGRPPLVGISHDVRARFKPFMAGGRRLQEATVIEAVQSADLVADPSAGGVPVRALAGGVEGTDIEIEIDSTELEPEEGEEVPTTEAVLNALRGATDDQLSAVGLPRPATMQRATEAGEPKDSVASKLLIHMRLNAAGITDRAAEVVRGILPDRVTEASIDEAVAAYKALLAPAERAALRPVAVATVVTESVDRKRGALDAMLAGNYRDGYRSLKQAFIDFSGLTPDPLGEDFNRVMLRESIGSGFDSGAVRATESATSGTWSLILGDSITRRMVAEYQRPSLQTWRQICSSIIPVNDFRTQRIDRLGGYGTLPAVSQGQPYQPLTTPGNEESTYAITKRGGTDDLTLETIANDDLRVVQRIPTKLGLAAAQTLFRFVWDILPTNAAVTYDSVALFHSSHSNTTTGALSQTNLSAVRIAMRQQTAYGDSKDVLSIVPRFLVVPSNLEEIGFQLVTSAVAIPATPAGPTDTPNIHQGMSLIVIDYYTDTNDWYVTCDPTMCPTIEIGFYQGREDPELFTQNSEQVGSMFNSDTLTFKIRHIYSGTVVEHRGMQRSVN